MKHIFKWPKCIHIIGRDKCEELLEEIQKIICNDPPFHNDILVIYSDLFNSIRDHTTEQFPNRVYITIFNPYLIDDTMSNKTVANIYSFRNLKVYRYIFTLRYNDINNNNYHLSCYDYIVSQYDQLIPIPSAAIRPEYSSFNGIDHSVIKDERHPPGRDNQLLLLFSKEYKDNETVLMKHDMEIELKAHHHHILSIVSIHSIKNAIQLYNPNNILQQQYVDKRVVSILQETIKHTDDASISFSKEMSHRAVLSTTLLNRRTFLS